MEGEAPLEATEATLRLRDDARDKRRRGVVFMVTTALSFWHFFHDDGWWSTPEGAVAHTAMSILVVAAGTWAGRAWGAALFFQQPLVLLTIVGVIQTRADWPSGDVAVFRVFDRDPDSRCSVDANSRLRICSPPAVVPSCIGGPDYRNILDFATGLSARGVAAVLGPPPGSYLGAIPTADEAFRMAKEAASIEMTEAAVDEAFVVAGGPGAAHRERHDWRWRSTGSLEFLALGDDAGPAVLFSWDHGSTVDQFDARSGRFVAEWATPQYRAPRARAARYPDVDNAVWLRRRWLHEPTSDAEVLSLVQRVHGHQIGTLYPFIGPMRPGGRFGWRDGDTLVEYDPETARSFFARAHGAEGATALSSRDWLGLRPFGQRAGRVTILPWTGGVLGRDVFPDDAQWRADFVAQAKALVELGADGIHLNVEPMPEETAGYLDLLREIKAAIGPEKLVSVAAYPPTTPLHPYADVHWSTNFLRLVCEVSDDVSVMAYDTSLGERAAYSDLVHTWTNQIVRALRPLEADEGTSADGRGCRWRIGVPSYDDDEPWHRPDAETLAAGLDGVMDAFPGSVEMFDHRGEPPRSFAGLAVYSSWTTDAQEWAEFDIRWNLHGPIDNAPIDAP